LWSLIAIPICLLSGLALGLWVFPGSHHREEAGNFLKVVGFLLFSVFLTYFTLSRSRSPASGDEEFEAIFREMLERAEITGDSDRRLIVFVDELDRCAPSEVAATLESIRTFLGVQGCIFIVAADQQVLEHALTEQLRQSTPPDLANPYYSAGSAYLDKIFQYQLSFPPLRARRLSAFALELVENRKGVWADPDVDEEDVISILLPTHIHSPRRVKVLLNAFALSYGIASERAKREKLPAIAGRASEIAKLVCIKLEFPLFARDLALDERLIPAVTLAARSIKGDLSAQEELEHLPEELRLRAKQYASGQLRVAQLLSAEDPEQRASAPPPASDPDRPDGTPADDEDQEEPKDQEQERADEDRESSAAGINQGTVQASHATQLVRYLEKTDRIPGPAADLIHLESAGARWRLDAQEAEILERDARDNRTEAVAKRIAALPPDDRPKALLMLGNLAREAVGYEADSALSGMLAGAAVAEVPLEPIARELVKDVKAYDDRRTLKDPHLAGALVIAIAAKNHELIESILDRNAIVKDEDLRFAVLENGAALLPRHRDRLIEVLPRSIRSDFNRTKAALDALDSESAEDLLRSSAGSSAHYANHQSEQAAKLEEAGDPNTANSHKEAADATVTASAELAELFLAENPVLAELAFLPVFDMPLAGEHVFHFLEAAGPLKTADASLKVLAELDQYELDRTVTQLQALDATIVKDLEEAAPAMDRLAGHVWIERADDTTAVPEGLSAEVTRLFGTGLRPHGDSAIEKIQDDVNRNVASDEELAEFQKDEGYAYALAELGLIPSSFVADSAIRTVARSLSGPVPEPRPSEIFGGCRSSIELASGEASTQSLEGALEQVVEGTWLEPPEQLVIELLLQAALSQHHEGNGPSADEIRALVAEGQADDLGVATWIDNFAASPNDVYTVVEPFIEMPPVGVQAAISEYAAQIGPKALAELNLPAVAGAFSRNPSRRFFEAAALNRADAEPVGDALVELATEADNLEKRTLVLDIWEQLDPSKRKVRETLIRKIYLRFAEAGATSHDLARKRLRLVTRPPSGIRDELLKRLVASAPDEKRKKKLEKKLEQVGLIKGSPGFISRLFGRR
jgi:KAP-like P-loop domain-containing protein